MKKDEDIKLVKFSKKYVRNQRIVRLSFFHIPITFGIFYIYFYGLNIGFIINSVANIIIALFPYFLWYTQYKASHPSKIRFDKTGIYSWKLNETEELIKWDSIQETKDKKFLGEKLKVFTYRPDKPFARGFFSFTNHFVLPIEIGNTVELEYRKNKP